jgi:hypothetical protein
MTSLQLQPKCERFRTLPVRMRFPKINVIVYVPANNPVRGQAFELRGAANRHRDLPLNLLGKALFPSTIIPSIGPAIVKPNDW